MSRRESLYAKYPDYRVDTEPSPRRMRATLGDVVIAESDGALVVRESKHDPVVYFPRADVRLDLAERTTNETFCPFKGEASYWTFTCGDAPAENVAWSYEDPFDEVAAIRDFVAFYPDRVEVQPAD